MGLWAFRPGELTNVAFIGVQVVLTGGMLLLAVLILLGLDWLARVRTPLSILPALVRVEPARAVSTLIRPAAGFSRPTPPRAPPMLRRNLRDPDAADTPRA